MKNSQPDETPGHIVPKIASQVSPDSIVPSKQITNVSLNRIRGVPELPGRSGHRKQWNELVKMVLAVYQKIPDAHWATYGVAYGRQPNPTYVVFNGLNRLQKSTTNALRTRISWLRWHKKLDELEASAIASRQAKLFSLNPKMSDPTVAFIKADPGFWKPKVKAPAMPKKPDEKPAGPQ